MFRPAINALEYGASEIERMRRTIELQTAQLDMLRVLHEITNPRVQHPTIERGYSEDIVYTMRRVASNLRERMEAKTEFATVNPDTFTAGSKDVE